MGLQTTNLTNCLTKYFNIGSQELRQKEVQDLSQEIIAFVEKIFQENQEASSFEFFANNYQFKTGVLTEIVIVDGIKAAIYDLHPDFKVETDEKFKISNFKTSRSSCKFKVVHLSS